MKYGIQLVEQPTKDYNRPEVLDEADLSLALGTRNLMEIYDRTPKGIKKITIIAKVERFK